MKPSLQVHVSVGFCLAAMAPGIASGAAGFLAWGSALSLTVLAHELARAAVGLSYGSRASITLLPLGGVTRFTPPLSPRKAVASDLLAPLVNLSLGGALYLTAAHLHSNGWLILASRAQLVWGALQLLPALPFGGGRALCAVLPLGRQRMLLLITACAATSCAILALFVCRHIPTTAVFGVMAWASSVEWTQRARRHMEERLGLERLLDEAHEALRWDRYSQAEALGAHVARYARQSVTIHRAAHTQAWALLGAGRAHEARDLLLTMPRGFSPDPYCQAAVESGLGQLAQAIRTLEKTQAREELSEDASKLLIDLYAQAALWERAASMARARFAQLNDHEVRSLADALERAGRLSFSTELTQRLRERRGRGSEAPLATGTE